MRAPASLLRRRFRALALVSVGVAGDLARAHAAHAHCVALALGPGRILPIGRVIVSS